ncbi:MAG: hypothetical protein AAGJ11_15095 [Bacteroidota bacterium]
MTVTLRPAWPVLAFAAVALAVYLVAAFVVVPAMATAPQAEALAVGLVVDLVVLVPLAYGLLLVRTRGRSVATLGPVIALSGLGACLVLPDAHQGRVALAVLLAEAALMAAVAVAIVRAVRLGAEGDPYGRIQAAATHVLGDHIGSRALASEIAVARYALGPLGAPEAGTFGYRRSSGFGAVLAGVAVAAAVELVGGHLLVTHVWGETAALVHLAVSGYAILWLVADWRALGARPHRPGEGTLHVRCGLRWNVDVPLDAIEAVYRVRGPLPTDAPVLDASVLKNADLLLDLRRPVTARGPYGLRREVARVAFGADDPEAVLEALEGALRR